jgi:DNA-binding response OmpR family regulator
MKREDELWVLVINSEEEPVSQMERVVIDLEINTQRVRTYRDANAVLRIPLRPSLVVTDAPVPHGIWLEVLHTARAGLTQVPVILVSRVVDMQLHLDALGSGAHDFVVPPFTIAELTFISRTAIREDSRNGCSAPLVARKGLVDSSRRAYGKGR